MSDYIKREDAIKVVRHVAMECVDTETRQMLIESIPSADVVDKADYDQLRDIFDKTYESLQHKRERGEWQVTDDTDEWYGHVYKCSICGGEAIGGCYNFCPNCGADMRGER